MNRQLVAFQVTVDRRRFVMVGRVQCGPDADGLCLVQRQREGVTYPLVDGYVAVHESQLIALPDAWNDDAQFDTHPPATVEEFYQNVRAHAAADLLSMTEKEAVEAFARLGKAG